MADDDKLFGERRQALEDSFFRKEEERALQALKSKKAREESLSELGKITGVTDQAVIQRLVDLGVTVETAAAMSLVPPVLVAWADGQCDDKEKAAVLEAAQQSGITAGSPARALLEGWLDRQPPADLEQTWATYFDALASRLPEKDAQALGKELLARARKVAEISGGILGLFERVSRSETSVLHALEKVLLARR
jgi:tellurite resistance protein